VVGLHPTQIALVTLSRAARIFVTDTEIVIGTVSPFMWLDCRRRAVKF
jgi:hypothetical protein